LVGRLDKTSPQQQQQTAAERQFLICGKVIAEPKGFVFGRTDDFIERFLMPVLIYQKEDG
jgi:hypothetical protein